MGAPKTGNVRNVVLVGQGGVGKTSLAEAMLHLSGKTARLAATTAPSPRSTMTPKRSSVRFHLDDHCADRLEGCSHQCARCPVLS